MPAPIDWPGLRAAAVAIGIRPACARAFAALPPDEARRLTERAMKRCSREGWLSQAEELRTLAIAQSPLTPSAKVRTGADALSDALADDSKATRVAASRYARRTLEHAAEVAATDPGAALKLARNAKESTAIAQVAHGWGASTGTERISIYGSQVVIASPDVEHPVSE